MIGTRRGPRAARCARQRAAAGHRRCLRGRSGPGPPGRSWLKTHEDILSQAGATRTENEAENARALREEPEMASRLSTVGLVSTSPRSSGAGEIDLATFQQMQRTEEGRGSGSVSPKRAAAMRKTQAAVRLASAGGGGAHGAWSAPKVSSAAARHGRAVASGKVALAAQPAGPRMQSTACAARRVQSFASSDDDGGGGAVDAMQRAPQLRTKAARMGSVSVQHQQRIQSRSSSRGSSAGRSSGSTSAEERPRIATRTAAAAGHEQAVIALRQSQAPAHRPQGLQRGRASTESLAPLSAAAADIQIEQDEFEAAEREFAATAKREAALKKTEAELELQAEWQKAESDFAKQAEWDDAEAGFKHEEEWEMENRLFEAEQKQRAGREKWLQRKIVRFSLFFH